MIKGELGGEIINEFNGLTSKMLPCLKEKKAKRTKKLCNQTWK